MCKLFQKMCHLILSPKDNMRTPVEIRFNHTMLDGYTTFFGVQLFLASNYPISTHRTPDNPHEYAKSAIDRCLRCIIASTSGAAHLAGALADKINAMTLTKFE